MNGGGGLNWYLPYESSTSGKFRPAALTSMRTSPARAAAPRRRPPGGPRDPADRDSVRRACSGHTTRRSSRTCATLPGPGHARRWAHTTRARALFLDRDHVHSVLSTAAAMAAHGSAMEDAARRSRSLPGPRGGSVEDVLRDRFGLASFRPWQREAIDAVLGESGRVLVVAPTGGGKSLTYQLPAAVLDGLTLVVSPLVALDGGSGSLARGARGSDATFLAADGGARRAPGPRGRDDPR